MLSAIQAHIHFVALAIYLFLVRRDLCPCQIARRIDHILFVVGRAISKAAAYVGGALCRRLDTMISASDAVCDAGCTGCAPKEAA